MKKFSKQNLKAVPPGTIRTVNSVGIPTNRLAWSQL
jgi:hypothetical protein